MQTPTLVDRQQLAACFLLNRHLLEDFLSAEKSKSAWAEEKGMKLWVEGLDRFYELMGRPPSITAFKAMLNNLYKQAPWTQDYSDETATQVGILRGAVATAESFEEKNKPEDIERMGRKLLQQYLYFLLRTKLTDRLSSGADMAKVLSGAQKEMTHIGGLDGSRFKKPFPMNDFPSRKMSFAPTGIDFVDSFLAGGMLSGEVIGHAAPIGSGKTTLVLQVMWSRAQQQLAQFHGKPLSEIPLTKLPHIYGFFFEHVELLYANFISNAAGIPRKTMEQYALSKDRAVFSTSMSENYKKYEISLFGKDIEEAKRKGGQLPFGEFERMQWAAAVANDLISFIDFSGGDESLSDWASQGVDGMAAYIKAHQHVQDNPGVNVCMLDYVGAMVEVATSSGHYNVRDRINVLKSIPTHMTRLITGPFRCPAWASHQLNSEQNDRDGGTIPNPNKTDGCHMFLENCAMGFASGKLTEDGNVAVYVAGKNRRSERPKPMLSKLDHTYARWIGANDSHQLVEGRVLSKAEVAARARVDWQGTRPNFQQSWTSSL